VILELFDVRSSGNTATHYIISVCLLIAGLVLRRIVTTVFFGVFRRMAARTQTTLDDKMFVALEPPVGTLVMLIGVFAALKVLKLSPKADEMIAYSSTVAFSLAIFWLLLRAFSTVLDHAHSVATAKNKGIAAFMPWIKKTLIAVFVIIGVLMVIQSLGFNVRAILAGLGLGGLAFALAAQDTLANVFGSIVVAIDQPFRIGEFVQIGANSGAVEDIGLRSTKLRRSDKALVIVPNKTVAAEAVINLARFTRRRTEQVVGLTYDTTPDQMDAIVKEIRELIVAQTEVDKNSVMVFFRDLNASSLDIWIAYETPNPDFQQHMSVKQRINLGIMRRVEARGLSFAFPTQTVQFAGSLAEKMADGRSQDVGLRREGRQIDR
jgi:MscS family membrane protein